ncbi:MAG: T9SS type A sorting domain-containing protein [Bacteroidota bacterium]
MKTIFTLLTLLALTSVTTGFAQTTYTVNSNSSYSASCSNCVFNIADNVTLTIKNTGTCNGCTFNGGNIEVEHTITCQPCSFNDNNITLDNQSIKPNSNTTSFKNVVLTATGNSAIIANTAVTITNSVFTFNNNSYFNNSGGQLDISNSSLNFFGNAYFIANAGPVNLKNGSKLVVGNGLLASNAYIKMNGPALNIYDATSSIILSNYNNYYFNWGSYNSLSNNKTFTTTYPTTASTLNCGGAGQNACGMWGAPTVYGPSAFNFAGVASMNALLPVLLTNFAATTANNQVALNWTTQQELNAAYFSVERSAIGSAWENIGTVPAKGNATALSSYTYADAAPLNGAAFYRLVVVDLDGSKSYSSTKTVRALLVKEISFYPNPAINNVHISLNSTSETTIQLMNQSGQVLQEQKVAGNTALVSFNVQQYPRGMYILKVATADGTTQTGKLLVAR